MRSGQDRAGSRVRQGPPRPSESGSWLSPSQSFGDEVAVGRVDEALTREGEPPHKHPEVHPRPIGQGDVGDHIHGATHDPGPYDRPVLGASAGVPYDLVSDHHSLHVVVSGSGLGAQHDVESDAVLSVRVGGTKGERVAAVDVPRAHTYTRARACSQTMV